MVVGTACGDPRGEPYERSATYRSRSQCSSRISAVTERCATSASSPRTAPATRRANSKSSPMVSGVAWSQIASRRTRISSAPSGSSSSGGSSGGMIWGEESAPWTRPGFERSCEPGRSFESFDTESPGASAHASPQPLNIPCRAPPGVPEPCGHRSVRHSNLNGTRVRGRTRHPSRRLALRLLLRSPFSRLVFALALVFPACGTAQSVVERSPNLSGGWVGDPGTVYFNFLHRFEHGAAPARKVTNFPTFLLGYAPVERVLIGAQYATPSLPTYRSTLRVGLLGLRERMEENGSAVTGEAKRSAAAPADPEVVDRPFGRLQAGGSSGPVHRARRGGSTPAARRT